jgi:hypothetical protein
MNYLPHKNVKSFGNLLLSTKGFVPLCNSISVTKIELLFYCHFIRLPVN